jgi:Polyketide cyclase / dehydrase and lipid transport
MIVNPHLACPTAIVEAPLEVVWDLLLNTAEWGRFYDVRVLSVIPPGPARPGQRLVGNPGPKFLPLRLVFEFTEVDSTIHKLGFNGRLPFGIRVREDMMIAPIDATRCRVNYNCGFELPQGLLGQILWRFLRREFDSGPADSLSRLKREAERIVDFRPHETRASKIPL